jgi:monofunctional biosynthetic peptidoglycan transglycosylase
MTVLALTLPGPSAGDEEKMKTLKIINFSSGNDVSWQVINDGVMGGLSSSRMQTTKEAVGRFEGIVSLENNGGFASVRMALGELDLSAFDGLMVRVAGDGKRYRLRLRTERRFDGIAYQATFNTGPGEWETIEIPFDSFVPTFRGRILKDEPPLNTRTICQLGLMIADKQAGRFSLDIEWVKAFKKAVSGPEGKQP